MKRDEVITMLLFDLLVQVVAVALSIRYQDEFYKYMLPGGFWQLLSHLFYRNVPARFISTRGRKVHLRLSKFTLAILGIALLFFCLGYVSENVAGLVFFGMMLAFIPLIMGFLLFGYYLLITAFDLLWLVFRNEYLKN